MDKEELQAVAEAAAKNIKTEADLNEFRQMLTKITVETALNAELDDHLGFANEQSDADNSRNGYTSNTLQTEDGRFEVDTPGGRVFSSSKIESERSVSFRLIESALYRSFGLYFLYLVSLWSMWWRGASGG